MESVNRNKGLQRTNGVWDTFVGAQVSQDGVKKYDRKVRKDYGIDKNVDESQEFLRDYKG